MPGRGVDREGGPAQATEDDKDDPTRDGRATVIWRIGALGGTSPVLPHQGTVDRICYRNTLFPLLVEGGRSSGAQERWNRGLCGMVPVQQKR